MQSRVGTASAAAALKPNECTFSESQQRKSWLNWKIYIRSVYLLVAFCIHLSVLFDFVIPVRKSHFDVNECLLLLINQTTTNDAVWRKPAIYSKSDPTSKRWVWHTCWAWERATFSPNHMLWLAQSVVHLINIDISFWEKTTAKLFHRIMCFLLKFFPK